MTAKTARISCINKNPRLDAYHRITHIGGAANGGWKLTLQQAINYINSGEWSFYVERPTGDVVWVVVARSRAGNEYLRTTADGDEPNNLLSLPECL